MRKRSHCITEPRQAAALVNPVRLELLDRLAALGPLTARELAQAIGRQPTAIYRHLKTLEEVGLIVPVKQPADRGRPFAIYRAIAPRIRLGRPSSHPPIKGLVGDIAEQTASEAARAYRMAIDDPSAKITGPRRTHSFFRVVCAPSPERVERINALLDEIVELVWTPDPNPGPLLSIAWFLSPIRRARSRQDR